MPSSEPIKMPERSWPKDMLGNEIRRGSLVSLRIPEQIIVGRVVDVVQAGIMHGPDGNAITLHGSLKLGMEVGYQPDVPVANMVCLKEPEK